MIPVPKILICVIPDPKSPVPDPRSPPPAAAAPARSPKRAPARPLLAADWLALWRVKLPRPPSALPLAGARRLAGNLPDLAPSGERGGCAALWGLYRVLAGAFCFLPISPHFYRFLRVLLHLAIPEAAAPSSSSSSMAAPAGGLEDAELREAQRDYLDFLDDEVRRGELWDGGDGVLHPFLPAVRITPFPSFPSPPPPQHLLFGTTDTNLYFGGFWCFFFLPQEDQGVYHGKVRDMISDNQYRLLVSINDLRRKNEKRASRCVGPGTPWL